MRYDHPSPSPALFLLLRRRLRGLVALSHNRAAGGCSKSRVTRVSGWLAMAGMTWFFAALLPRYRHPSYLDSAPGKSVTVWLSEREGSAGPRESEPTSLILAPAPDSGQACLQIRYRHRDWSIAASAFRELLLMNRWCGTGQDRTSFWAAACFSLMYVCGRFGSWRDTKRHGIVARCIAIGFPITVVQPVQSHLERLCCYPRGPLWCHESGRDDSATAMCTTADGVVHGKLCTMQTARAAEIKNATDVTHQGAELIALARI